MKISVVSPVYLAEKIVEELVKRITEEVTKLTDDYEIVLVDDCGPDNSWQKIKEQCELNERVKGIRLSRNFGQHPAIKAGVQHSTGDVVIIMDCDLQDDPVYMKELIDEYHKGNEIVYTYKDKRAHGWFKNMTSYVFSKIFSWLVDNKSVDYNRNIGAYSLISRKVADHFVSFPDYKFHYLIVLRWLGYQSSYVKIAHRERFEGKSSYTLSKLLERAFEGIVYQSNKLLKTSVFFGFFLAFCAIIYALVIVVNYFYLEDVPTGWSSLATLILFLSGIILIFIGILGAYIGSVFEQVKNRPQYIIREIIN